MGLELALKFKIRHIEIFGNAELVIKQMTTEYEVRYEGLAMYHDLAQRLFECFPDASITHVPRKDNAIADAFRNKGISWVWSFRTNSELWDLNFMQSLLLG